MKFEILEDDVDIRNINLKTQEGPQVGFDLCLVFLSYGDCNAHSLVFLLFSYLLCYLSVCALLSFS